MERGGFGISLAARLANRSTKSNGVRWQGSINNKVDSKLGPQSQGQKRRICLSNEQTAKRALQTCRQTMARYQNSAVIKARKWWTV